MYKKLFPLVLLLVASCTQFAQNDANYVLETVEPASIKGHIYFLADDVLKGRDTGSPEIKIAASYLANQLRGYGAKPNPKTGNYYQAVPMEKKFPPESIAVDLAGEQLSDAVAVAQGNIDYQGEMIYLNYGLKEDYLNADVKGKVVVLRSGGPEGNTTQQAFSLIQEKIELATANGAIGIIELLEAGKQIWSFVNGRYSSTGVGLAGGSTDNSIPFIWARDSNGNKAKSMNLLDKVSGEVKMIKKASETFDSYNVVGWIEGSDPVLKDEFIIYSGHYDHIGVGSPDGTGDTIYNGARDNAVGVTTVLSMAKNLSKYPTKRSALFILFTGEEKGLLGSKYYVDNPILPLNQMVYCFNSDNGGYNNTTLATVVGLSRTTAEQHIIKACKTFGLKVIDYPTADSGGLFDRSDNVNFARKGIPSPTFSLGFDAFDGEIMKYYHRPADEAEGLDYAYLEKFFKAYVMAGRLIGNDTKTPVWAAGDKYEAASKELYGNK